MKIRSTGRTAWKWKVKGLMSHMVSSGSSQGGGVLLLQHWVRLMLVHTLLAVSCHLFSGHRVSPTDFTGKKDWKETRHMWPHVNIESKWGPLVTHSWKASFSHTLLPFAFLHTEHLLKFREKALRISSFQVWQRGRLTWVGQKSKVFARSRPQVISHSVCICVSRKVTLLIWFKFKGLEIPVGWFILWTGKYLAMVSERVDGAMA